MIESLQRGALGVAFALLLFASAPLDAQTLIGRVSDGSSRQAISDAQVTLLHPDGSELGSPVFSGEDGGFILSIPGPGEYFVRVERSSYTAIVDGIFEFTAPTGQLEIQIYLVRQPIELEGFTIEAERRQIRRNLRSQGFYQRADAGFGDFVGPEEIEERMVVNTSDYLRRIPGIVYSGEMVLFRGSGPGQEGGCEPHIWIDGIRAIRGSDTIGGANGSESLNNRITPGEVIAIEVYRRPSSMPLQWGGVGTTCGAIVIWTRGGSGG